MTLFCTHAGPTPGLLLHMLKMTMIGNLGRDAEVRDVNGQKVIAFTVAHSEKYTDRNGQQQERTQWVACSYWRNDGQTRVAEYLKVGQKVYVEGFPSVKPYLTKDGQQAASLELRVLSLELVGSRNDDGGQRPQGGNYQSNQGQGNYNAPGGNYNQGYPQPPQGAQPQPQPQRPAEPAYNNDGYTNQAGQVDDDLPF